MARVGDDLRRLRHSRGLTQADLARRAGLSVEGVSLLERGRRAPRIPTMLLLVDALNLSEVERQTLLRATADVTAMPAPIPSWPGELLGRDTDLTKLATILDRGTRLLTITGPGGVGKTRIAATIARRMAPRRADGARWIRVGSIHDLDGWLKGVADALGCGGVSSIDSIVGYLANRELMLVLDNAEPLLKHVRTLVRAVQQYCPDVQLVATSRLRIRLPGETSYVLPRLALPSHLEDETDLRAAPATALFLRSASRPADLALTEADVAAIARICRRVDGLPLGIELVAAQADVMALPELADAVDASITARSGRDASGLAPGLDRQLTEAIVGWCYDALRPAEQEAFASLSVFAGSFCAWDAECVLGRGAAQTTDSLTLLMANSLLLRAPDVAGVAMFRMLHPIRVVAADQLARRPHAEGDVPPSRRTHHLLCGKRGRTAHQTRRRRLAGWTRRHS